MTTTATGENIFDRWLLADDVPLWNNQQIYIPRFG